MPTDLETLLPAIAVLANPARSADLTEVASLVGLSPSRAQRVIAQSIGESPKRYQLRTRLELGALFLASTDARIIDVAFATGFESHETFTRAFRGRFGECPSTWRSMRRHTLTLEQARLGASISRCSTLYNRPLSTNRRAIRRSEPMTYDITIQDVAAVPVIFQARKVEREQIGTALAECLPAVFGYVMENGLAPAGHPFVRYNSMSSAYFEIHAGIPLVEAASDDPPAESAMSRGKLPAGRVATTIHTGPYEGLAAAYAELDRWIEASEHTSSGPPWEVYLTDPGEVPDPAQWQTQVFFPVG